MSERAAPAAYSLSRRLLVWVSVALAVFLGVSALALDAIFRDLAQRSLRELLDAQMVALIAAIETDEEGHIRAASTQAESRLQTPGSGLYAGIRMAGGPELWRSPSTAGTFLDFGADAAPGSAQFEQRRLPDGRHIALARRGIRWEVGSGPPQRLTLAVATSMAPYEQQLRRFRTQLGGGLLVLSAMLLLTLAWLLRRVMSPLRRLEQEIAAVEAGTQEALGTGYPRELAGVSGNLNALLTAERRRIDRYRNTLGNLAHSLKTPLAVLRGALSQDAPGGHAADVVVREVDRMNGIIEHQLHRAAASGGALLGQPPVEIEPVAQELRRVLGRVYGGKDLLIEIRLPAGLQFFGERADLTEALGNLLDNACKWSRGRVQLSGGIDAPGSSSARGVITLVVEDDGPGLPPALREQGPARGRRADETTPGHGIGLAMVQEMAEGYGGSLRLGTAAGLGGARLELRLPGRSSAKP
ncbi:MAG: two-component sensor histidine kinase [Sinobacteraceae bacterium]|nr:two-component sensor histidine kinase [Nevskiaceae bacterium]